MRGRGRQFLPGLGAMYRYSLWLIALLVVFVALCLYLVVSVFENSPTPIFPFVR